MTAAGVADHRGWAVIVTVAADGRVLDRRRAELIDDDLGLAPEYRTAPRKEFCPPWTADHRRAYAAALLTHYDLAPDHRSIFEKRFVDEGNQP